MIRDKWGLTGAVLFISLFTGTLMLAALRPVGLFPLAAYGAGVVAAILYVVFAQSKRLAIAGGAALILGGTAAFLTGALDIEAVNQLINYLYRYADESVIAPGRAIATNSLFFSVSLICGAFSILCYAVPGGTFLSVLACAGLIGVPVAFGHVPAVYEIVLMLLALGILLSEHNPASLKSNAGKTAATHGEKRARSSAIWALPVISLAIISGMTFKAILPDNYAPLSFINDTIRSWFFDFVLFDGERAQFSLLDVGYQLFQNQLGGPVEPSEEPVLLVISDSGDPLYLRGVAKNNYTGAIWEDTLGTRRYLYNNVRWRDQWNIISEQDTPNADILSAYPGILRASNFDVVVLGETASTLFLPGRTRNIVSPWNRAIYFNNASEIFTTRSLTEGDTYGGTALLPDMTASSLPALLSDASQGDDELYETFRSLYAQAPDGGRVRELTEGIVSGIESPYGKAVAISNYIKSHFSYSTIPPYPPRDTDFVGHFIFETKSGYCTYFASAMAVMARYAGLPSRYVEGFVARPENAVSESEAAKLAALPEGYGESALYIPVTSKDAHAWAEIYFEGFGWLVIDPTPGDSSQPLPEPEQTQEPLPEPTPRPEQAQPPETEPTPPQSDQPTQKLSVSAWQSLPPLARIIISIVFWILTAILLLIVVPRMYVWLLNPARKSAKLDNARAIVYYYYEIMLLLDMAGYNPNPKDTPIAIAEAVDNLHLTDESAFECMRCISGCFYSDLPPMDSDIYEVHEYASALKLAVRARLGLRYVYEYMLKSIAARARRLRGGRGYFISKKEFK